MAQITLETFRNFFKYYKSLEHQETAIETLYEELEPWLLEDESEWIREYRDQVEKPESEPTPKPSKGICTSELMERLTGHPAASFDSDICRAPAGALQISLLTTVTVCLLTQALTSTLMPCRC